MLGVVGDLLEDIVVWLREPVQQATDTDVRIFRQRGGSAANVAAFAGPRYPTRFLGRVGSDAAGDAVVADLVSHGVDVKVQRFGVTGSVVVLIDERGERTMLPDRGVALLLTNVDESWTRDLTHLHIPAYSLVTEPIGATAVDLIGRMRRQGASISIDASSTGALRRYGKERFLRLVAVFSPELLFANRDEADYLGLLHRGRSGPSLAGMTQTIVVVKDGEQPSTVLVPRSTPFEVPVPAVAHVRDSTGAGDAFAAGFLTDYLTNHDPRTACEAGHACAALVLGTPGASMSRRRHSPL